MKYTYRYYIQTNYICYGRSIVSEAYKTRAAAAFWLDCYIYKYGCCDIVRRRYYGGE